MSTDRQICKKNWYKYAVEYYSALKRKESLTYATTWVSLEDITQSKISQSQKRQILDASISVSYLETEIIETESRWWMPRNRGRGR